MNQLTVNLHDVSIRASGFGGGFIYIYGKTNFHPYGLVDVYCYFSDSTEDNAIEEKIFKENYAGGNLQITSNEWKYIRGIGLDLQKIQWKST